MDYVVCNDKNGNKVEIEKKNLWNDWDENQFKWSDVKFMKFDELQWNKQLIWYKN